jgi:hypothetical protein
VVVRGVGGGKQGSGVGQTGLQREEERRPEAGLTGRTMWN